MATSDSMTVRLAGESRPKSVRVEPDADWCAALADDLGILGVRKLRLEGDLRPDGKTDWLFEGELGATATQSCVVTLEPVTTRVDVPVIRRYVAGLPEPAPGTETEMPEDDSQEPLPETLDLGRLIAEALALALPDFPRADGVDVVQMSVAEPGVTPMSDDDAKPFAGLADLRDRLAKKGDDED